MIIMGRRPVVYLIATLLLLFALSVSIAQNDTPPPPPSDISVPSDSGGGGANTYPTPVEVAPGVVPAPDDVPSGEGSSPDALAPDQGLSPDTLAPDESPSEALPGGDADIGTPPGETAPPEPGELTPEDGENAAREAFSIMDITKAKTGERSSSDEKPPTEMLAATPTGPEQNWPMFAHDPGHNGHTGEQMSFPSKLAWKYSVSLSADELKSSSDNPSSPVVADGVVYFSSGRWLYAVNAETGSLKWRYPSDSPLSTVIKSTPVIGEDFVYFGGGDGWLYAITKDKGMPAWSFATKGMINSSPTLVDGIIYVGSVDDRLYAIDALTGEQKWPGGFRTRDDVSTAPAVAEGLVYFMSSDMNLYSAIASTGRLKWSYRIGIPGRASNPVVADNAVYVAVGSLLQAYQTQSGHMKWGIRLPSDVTTTPAAADGSIYFACKNGKLYALLSSGKAKWKTPVDIGAPAYGSPVVVGNTIVVGANKGTVLAVDAETGDVKWKYTVMPSSARSGKLEYVNISAAPAVSNGSLYILADDGTLHAFRSDAPDNTPPQVVKLGPARDSLRNGKPPVEIAAVIVDPGSGIKPDSITMLLDDSQVEHKYAPERGIVWYRTPVTQPIVPLKNGRHTVTLKIEDWAGNKSETLWSFNVDSRIQSMTTGATSAATSNGAISRAAGEP
jgi:outer membrane protein assembly factor BamB